MDKPMKMSFQESKTNNIPIQVDDLLFKEVELPPFFDGRTEIHFHLNDVYIIVAGEAQVVVGKEFEGGIEIEDGEIRDCVIKAPIEYNITKGDIFIVPGGFAHKVITGSKGLIQYVVKYPL
jgi:mannose-6-phosphate isomerase-like protein (cupin superfamily)